MLFYHLGNETQGVEMTDAEIIERLRALRRAEGLKTKLRSGFLTDGTPESTAAHSWRLALWVMIFADQFEGLNIQRMLELAVIHDLGEAISGDIPAPLQTDGADKLDQERRDLAEVLGSLPEADRERMISIWEEYETGETPEAKWIKAFDKLETILQHNQGQNPDDFDYVFNLTYGLDKTDALPLTKAIRAILDADTQANARH